MRRIGNWSVTLATLAFVTLPLLAAGCAEQATSTTAASPAPSTDNGLDDLDEELDLGEPLEAGSALGFPESGSGLGLPESGSALE